MKTIQLEDRGFFWTSEEALAAGEVPATAVPGLLTIDTDGGIQLELDGMFAESGHPWKVILEDQHDALKDRVCWGLLKKNSQYVRLNGLLKNGGSARSRGISYVIYVVEACLVAGGPFPDSDIGNDVRELEVDLAGFENWISRGELQPTKTRRTLSVKHTTTKPTRYKLDDGALEFRSDILGPAIPQIRRHSVELKTLHSVSWAPRKPMTLVAAIERYRALQDLLILLTGSDRTLEWPTVTLGTTRHPATAYFHRIGGKSEPPGIHQLFTFFEQLAPKFGELYQCFIEMRRDIGPGIFLYLATRRGMTFYVEHRFASLVWGLESLHRRSKADQRTALDEKIARILEAVQPRDKRWLRGRLAFAGEPSLEERLFDLFSSLLLPMDVQEEKIRTFAKRCADVRNLISHFGGRRDADSESLTMEAQELSEVLGFIYHLLLLQKLGIESARLRALLYEAHATFRGRHWCQRIGLLEPAKA
ncbi:HEPN domain-containing protein [Variovorax sp. AFSI2.2]|uniref:HEPN domain-containing protein n=1 Tax=Variovorax sp. AFSI2.2 TaxID=3384160 RepID=UPI003EBD2412